MNRLSRASLLSTSNVPSLLEVSVSFDTKEKLLAKTAILARWGCSTYLKAVTFTVPDLEIQRKVLSSHSNHNCPNTFLNDLSTRHQISLSTNVAAIFCKFTEYGAHREGKSLGRILFATRLFHSIGSK